MGQSAILRREHVGEAIDWVLPPESVSTISQVDGRDGIVVLILETRGVPGLSVDEIMHTVHGVLLANLSHKVSAHVGFSSPPQVTLAIVSAPPPPPKEWPPSAAETGLSGVPDERMVGSILLVVMAISGTALVLYIVNLASWHQRRRRKQLASKPTRISTTEVETPIITTTETPPSLIKGPGPALYASMVSVTAEQPPIDGPNDDSLDIDVDIFDPSRVPYTPSCLNQHIRSNLDRIRAERRSRKGSNTGREDATVDASEDEDGEAHLEEESSALERLRNVRMSAVEQGSSLRLEQRIEEQRRADALLQQQQRKVRELMSSAQNGQGRIYDPDSAENRALIREQALALTLHARRRARDKVRSEGSQAVEQELDSITGSIHRSAMTGGLLHACDLSLDHARGNQKSNLNTDDVNSSADAWLANVMAPVSKTAVESGVALAGRVARARRTCSVAGSVASPTTTARVRRAMCDQESSSSRVRCGSTYLEDIVSPTKKPRGLMEIRSQSLTCCRTSTAKNEPGSSIEQLDPLTDALHRASLFGVTPPPPPDDWTSDPNALSPNAAERMARVRADRELVSRSPLRDRAVRNTTMLDSEAMAEYEVARANARRKASLAEARRQ